MSKDLTEVFERAREGDLDAMERAIAKFSRSSQTRAAAREMGLVVASAAGHAHATERLTATEVSIGNLALAHWNVAEAYLSKTHGLARDLARAELHLVSAAPWIRDMNGGKLLVSRAVARHRRIVGARALFDRIFGVAMTGFVEKSRRPAKR